eukprot:Mrub_10887.p1 GENE.Mrub_10887~~Mrub_10887.p1  ORF type:complete len:211 (-),score=19.37 Mrub_10887:20-619(-)
MIRETIYDVSEFMNSHPGGINFFTPFLMTDCTESFLNSHNPEILTLISHLAITDRQQISSISRHLHLHADKQCQSSNNKTYKTTRSSSGGSESLGTAGTLQHELDEYSLTNSDGGECSYYEDGRSFYNVIYQTEGSNFDQRYLHQVIAHDVASDMCYTFQNDIPNLFDLFTKVQEVSKNLNLKEYNLIHHLYHNVYDLE